ncbi:orotate phosphoribosyltransferase [Synechococcus sp. PCC 7336]|uniref:orotate phosphoribosyltransferase n=1 Tax=Synechococcus sp. PCC 7336 TaxID=195250 RepID=UPI00034CBA53|nr:orotate phosphoribosyltransferase [Synechococcus sp. PCC 7336]
MLLLSRSPLTLAPAEQKQALIYLIRELAYREGDFTLASGQKSSYYINCKPVTLHPQGAYLVGQLLLAELPASTQAVAGLTLGADPIVSAVSIASVYNTEGLTNLPALIVRKQAKGHGTQAYIEGPALAENTCIWILEDVVTTGASALQAAERIAGAGYEVGGILALVDREQGGAECYASAKLPFRRLLTIEDIRTAIVRF